MAVLYIYIYIDIYFSKKKIYIYIYIDIYIFHSLHAERDTVTQGHQTKPKTQKTIKLFDRF